MPVADACCTAVSTLTSTAEVGLLGTPEALLPQGLVSGVGDTQPLRQTLSARVNAPGSHPQPTQLAS